MRLFRLFLVLLLALALLPLAQALLPAERARRAALAACHAAPTVDCLIETGFTEAEGDVEFLMFYETEALVALGHATEARALNVRVQLALGLSPEAAAQEVDAELAAPLLAKAIRDGADPVLAAGDLDPGTLWSAALQLMDTEPFGPIPAEVPSDAKAGVAALAGLIEARATTPGALADAARLHAALGNGESARAALARIHGTPPGRMLDPVTIRAIGPEALTLCPDEPCRDAMRIALDPVDFAALTRVFDRIADIPTGPDVTRLGRLVTNASPGAGLALARRLAALVEARPEDPVELPRLTVARVLLTQGAPTEELRAAVARAEAAMPGGQKARDRETRSARRELAALLAALGEADRAAAWINGDSRPFWDWLAVLERPMPDAAVPAVLTEAAKVLEPRQMADLQACATHARASDEEKEWARQTLRAALTQDLEGYGPQGLECLAKAAKKLHLPVLRHRAGLALARAALDEPTARGLFDAALTLAPG